MDLVAGSVVSHQYWPNTSPFFNRLGVLIIVRATLPMSRSQAYASAEAILGKEKKILFRDTAEDWLLYRGVTLLARETDYGAWLLLTSGLPTSYKFVRMYKSNSVLENTTFI